MTTEELIEAIRAALRERNENDEFILTDYHDSTYTAEACNPVSSVRLGESSGKYKGYGATPVEALRNLHDMIINYDKFPELIAKLDKMTIEERIDTIRETLRSRGEDDNVEIKSRSENKYTASACMRKAKDVYGRDAEYSRYLGSGVTPAGALKDLYSEVLGVER